MLEHQWSNSVSFLLHDSSSFPPIFCPPKWSHLFLPINSTTIDREKYVTVNTGTIFKDDDNNMYSEYS
ncbi:hypothetical protein BVRB_3g054910 [Beta vulgaris subsp. vulgaris]|nr:hypothetical protein BVRB_3g054910 [Beta vulgaris subsp. vulgaris]